MPNQIVLAWTVSTLNSVFGPAAAATKLAAVRLFTEAESDPVLGQLFGLTVESDITAAGVNSATRTLTLNMTRTGSSTAPPAFVCHLPIIVEDPTEIEVEQFPLTLVEYKTLAGTFFVQQGSTNVPTTASQVPALSIGDVVRFDSRPGTRYEVIAVGATSITIDNPFVGPNGSTGAFTENPAPATIVAAYSTSPLDTAAVADVGILAGPGARTVEIEYEDSTGAGPFTATISLQGKKPALMALAPGSVDVYRITAFSIDTAGSFDNSVGQITLVELSAPPPSFSAEPTLSEFRRLTDETQILITRHLVYMPPSYFALAAQGDTTPVLEGDFFVTTGSPVVRTSVDQTGALSPGDVIQFASQLTINSPVGTIDVFYTVETVGAGDIKLTAPYTGVDENFTGNGNANTNIGTKGNLGATVTKKATAAMLIDPAAVAPPSNAALSAMLGQHVTTQVAAPPPDPPFPPATVPTPTFLSNLFTHTIQLALAGVPITPAPITFV